jgi:SAM-dependent methyltransferase
MKLLGKFFNSLKYRGVKKTILKAFIHFKPNTHKNWVEGRFTKIYQKNSWGSDESISGPGSTLEATEILRNELPIMFKKFSINSVFDAPCGDFNWMQSVVKSFDIEYIGGDIVKELVETNNKKYSSANVKFLHIDIINQSLPKVDLFLCRDCLYHFSYQDSEKVIQNFINSNISY